MFTGEELFNIVSGFQKISPQSGKILHNNTVDVAALNIGEHFLKAFALKIGTTGFLVNIDFVEYHFATGFIYVVLDDGVLSCDGILILAFFYN